ncbi:MAG TPA: hypothetical protein VNV25_09145 [Gemmatimonadaceae bacterium]|nr:hypothetical protein [Gemmatimonadaceae bacterium]
MITTSTAAREQFVDREHEQELFRRLLLFVEEARILAISDRTGTGKSWLLSRFVQHCHTQRPRIAAALIACGELPDSTPVALATEVTRQLTAFGLAFPHFAGTEAARLRGSLEPQGRVRPRIDVSGANFTDAKGVIIAETMLRLGKAQTVQVNVAEHTLTREQELAAQEASMGAFLNELAVHSASQPIVILLDSYEKCDARIAEWLHIAMLEQLFFQASSRDRRLLLVIAGQARPAFEARWPAAECALITRVIERLSQWQRAHLETVASYHGVQLDVHIESFVALLERGKTPQELVQIIKLFG